MQIEVKPLVSTDVNSAGQRIAFPRGDGHVEASLVRIPPGAVLPAHRHPFPRMGYVLEGELRVINEATGRSETYGPGSFVLESVEQWHAGTNPGTSSLTLLVIDLTEIGEPNTLFR